jgi:S1-C subfamily serine protease
MKRALIALLLGATPVPANEALPSPFFLELDLIERITCGNAMGSGVRIDGDLVLTADHVVAGRTCTIDNVPVELVHEDGERDIAIIRTASISPSRMPLSCAGFVTGRMYLAVGYARGEHLVVQRLQGTGGTETRDGRFLGLSELRGLIFPGMSGGAIVDETGQLVGIVNAGNAAGLSLSRGLGDTFLCGGH